MIQLDNFSVILQVRPDPPNVNFWEQLEQDFLHYVIQKGRKNTNKFIQKQLYVNYRIHGDTLQTTKHDVQQMHMTT